MSWDSSRPVPWQRLFKEAGLYAVLVGGVFLLLFRDQPPASIVSGLIFGTLLYLTVGWVMAKFGIERKTAAERRAEIAAKKAEGDSGSDSSKSGSSRSAGSRPRAKPEPTRRTNAQAGAKTTKKRRKR